MAGVWEEVARGWGLGKGGRSGRAARARVAGAGVFGLWMERARGARVWAKRAKGARVYAEGAKVSGL